MPRTLILRHDVAWQPDPSLRPLSPVIATQTQRRTFLFFSPFQDGLLPSAVPVKAGPVTLLRLRV